MKKGLRKYIHSMRPSQLSGLSYAEGMIKVGQSALDLIDEWANRGDPAERVISDGARKAIRALDPADEVAC